ncbi:MAG TPA: hypothetical protein VMU02_09300 [bacterium]|nr:hypothetical protein [bacterium]
MEETDPKLLVLELSRDAQAHRASVPDSVSQAGCSRHPCEHCRCCSCYKVCTKCRENCQPVTANLIPVLYCPDFVDVRELAPVRYLYKSDYECEYRLRLPGAR